jgi:putative hydrolase of the HAD superfamily
MSVVDCVVFDIDDTLYLEREYVRSGFRSVGEWVRRHLGIEDFTELACQAFERGVRRSTFNQVLKQRGIEPDPELIARLVDVYRAHQPDIELEADALTCLEALKGRVALASVTDGPLRSQEAKAATLDLARWMEPIVFTEELGSGFGKPHRRGFELVEKSVDCFGARCLYIADNPAKDFLGPKSLGWRTIRVRREEGLHAAVGSGPDVDAEMPDLGGLSGLIRSLDGPGLGVA